MKARVLLLIPALFATLPALAAFEVNPVPDPGKIAAPDMTGYVTIADRRIGYINHVGRPDSQLAAQAVGFSGGLPMYMALRLMLPQGWVAAVRPDIRNDVTVNWTSGATWVEALEQMGHQYDLAFTINWPNKTVLIEPLPAAARAGTKLPPPVERAAPAPVSLLTPAQRQDPARYVAPALAADLHDSDLTENDRFLSEMVTPAKVEDQTGLVGALRSIIPVEWQIDTTQMPSDVKLWMDRKSFSGRASRLAFFNALSAEYGVLIAPMAGMHKVAIYPSQTKNQPPQDAAMPASGSIDRDEAPKTMPAPTAMNSPPPLNILRGAGSCMSGNC